MERKEQERKVKDRKGKKRKGKDRKGTGQHGSYFNLHSSKPVLGTFHYLVIFALKNSERPYSLVICFMCN
jgi:hypothetical protein